MLQTVLLSIYTEMKKIELWPTSNRMGQSSVSKIHFVEWQLINGQISRVRHVEGVGRGSRDWWFVISQCFRETMVWAKSLSDGTGCVHFIRSLLTAEHKNFNCSDECTDIILDNGSLAVLRLPVSSVRVLVVYFGRNGSQEGTLTYFQ